MESLFKINERVWKTHETEYHYFSYLGEEYILVQSEHPREAAGYTYVFRQDVDCSISEECWQEDYEYTPILHIDWQAGGVIAYLLDKEDTVESTMILGYLLNTDPEKAKLYLDNDLLCTEVSDKDAPWRYFQLYLD